MSQVRPPYDASVAVVCLLRSTTLRDILPYVLPEASVVAQIDPRVPTAVLCDWSTIAQAVQIDERVLLVIDCAQVPLLDGLDAGARGVVDSGRDTLDRFGHLLLGIAHGQTILSSEQASALLTSWRTERSARRAVKLEPRELLVLEALVAGMTISATARRMGVSGKTVEHIRHAAYQKLGAKGRSQAVREALERGLVTESPARG